MRWIWIPFAREGEQGAGGVNVSSRGMWLAVCVCVCVGGANVENKKSEQLRFSQSDALMCIMIFSWDLKRIINNKNTWRTIEGAAKNVGVRLSFELGRRLSLRY